ncbi:MAG: hypothetical protein GY937_26330 [bacterium]|nr:hypothetical protein [bacterium]
MRSAAPRGRRLRGSRGLTVVLDRLHAHGAEMVTKLNVDLELHASPAGRG